MTWDESIDALVLPVVRNAPSFAALLQALPNVYPTDVLASIARLRAQGHDITDFTAGAAVHDERLHLPTPHPLDYEWRYTRTTRARLSTMINALAPTGTIAFLGAPSLYVTHDGAQTTILIDANSALAEHLPSEARWHHTNLLTDPIPAITADLVLADPPWYPEHLSAFLIAASALLRINGTLLLSLPGIGTRPTMREELDELYALAARAGLHHQTTTQGTLHYEIPRFERNALAAAGIALDAPWRAGDLAHFTKTKPSSMHRSTSSETPWREYRFDTVRIRVQDQRDADGDPRLISIIDGDILPTVSRRAAHRDQATIWTSGNRIFTTKSLTALHRVLRALQAGEPLSCNDENITEAVAQLRTLITREQTENEKNPS